MKNILILLLLATMPILSQPKIVARGVTLSYNKVKQSLTINIPEKLMITTDRDHEVKITINKEYSLNMTINGLPVSVSNDFFKHEGHIYDGQWLYLTFMPGYTKEIKKNFIYEFSNIESGEYILEVSDLCDGKWETNQVSQSLIVY